MELYAVLVRTGKHHLSNTVLLACSLIGTERSEASATVEGDNEGVDGCIPGDGRIPPRNTGPRQGRCLLPTIIPIPDLTLIIAAREWTDVAPEQLR